MSAFLMSALETLYTTGSALEAWGNENAPDENLIYKSGVSSQLRRIRAVADLLPQGEEHHSPRIVASHRSKSVKLPVTCFRFTPYGQVSAYVFVRDNFHDIKVVTVSDSPIYIPYPVMHQEWDQERYEAEVERYVNYTKNERPPEGSDEWFSKSWSHDTVLRRDGRIYRAGAHQSVYCEGINTLGLPAETFKPYEFGMQAFVCEVGSYATVATILEYVIGSLEKERFRRNQERHAAEKALTDPPAPQ